MRRVALVLSLAMVVTSLTSTSAVADDFDQQCPDADTYLQRAMCVGQNMGSHIPNDTGPTCSEAVNNTIEEIQRALEGPSDEADPSTPGECIAVGLGAIFLIWAVAEVGVQFFQGSGTPYPDVHCSARALPTGVWAVDPDGGIPGWEGAAWAEAECDRNPDTITAQVRIRTRSVASPCSPGCGPPTAGTEQWTENRNKSVASPLAYARTNDPTDKCFFYEGSGYYTNNQVEAQHVGPFTLC